MQNITYRPKFCSFEAKIGQLDRIIEKTESFGEKYTFLKIISILSFHARTLLFCRRIEGKQIYIFLINTCKAIVLLIESFVLGN